MNKKIVEYIIEKNILSENYTLNHNKNEELLKSEKINDFNDLFEDYLSFEKESKIKKYFDKKEDEVLLWKNENIIENSNELDKIFSYRNKINVFLKKTEKIFNKYKNQEIIEPLYTDISRREKEYKDVFEKEFCGPFCLFPFKEINERIEIIEGKESLYVKDNGKYTYIIDEYLRDLVNDILNIKKLNTTGFSKNWKRSRLLLKNIRKEIYSLSGELNSEMDTLFENISDIEMNALLKIVLKNSPAPDNISSVKDRNSYKMREFRKYLKDLENY